MPQTEVTTVSGLQESDMQRMKDRVIVLSDKGKPIRTFDSVKETAEFYNVKSEQVYYYINTGSLWRKHDIFLDFEMD